MAELATDDANIVANDDDLDRILSHSNAIIGNLDKLEGEAAVQCNGTSTVDLTELDRCSSTSAVVGVNNGRVTPVVSNPAGVGPQPVRALTTCAPCVTATRTDSGSLTIRAGAYAGPSAVQPTAGLIQPSRLIAPSTGIVDGRAPNAAHQSGLVTMLMRPSSSPGAIAPQLRAAVGRSPGGPVVPASSVQLVNVGSVTRGEQGTPRLVAVTGGMMPAGVRFIQSSPRQPQQQLRLQQQQVVAFETSAVDQHNPIFL